LDKGKSFHLPLGIHFFKPQDIYFRISPGYRTQIADGIVPVDCGKTGGVIHWSGFHDSHGQN
jgi:hypothetical protein